MKVEDTRSLVEEVLAQHNCPELWFGDEGKRVQVCGKCNQAVPCHAYRLATELQNAQAVVEAARTQSRNYNGLRDAMNEFPDYGAAWTEWIDAADVADEGLILRLARYDEGRKP